MSEFGDDMRDWRKRRQRDRAKNAAEYERAAVMLACGVLGIRP